MGSTVRFLGQAGLSIEHRNTKLLCDPWFSPTGAFLAAWHQFPRNSFLDTPVLHDATHLYISHLHEDHFDRSWLSSFPRKDVALLLAEFPTPILRNELAGLGFTDLEVHAPGSWFPLRDMRGMIFLDPAGYPQDSCLLLDLGGDFMVFNQNDCKIGPADQELIQGCGVDVHFVQFSGAHYYPVSYSYPREVMVQKVQEFREYLAQKFLSKVNTIAPKVVVPCAGPACFLDPDLFHLNFDSIFLDAQEFFPMVQSQLGARYLPLNPGDNLALPGVEIHRDPRGAVAPAKEAYLRAYMEERRPIIQHYLASLRAPVDRVKERLEASLQKALLKSPELARQIDRILCIEAPGAFRVFVDYRSDPPTFRDHAEGPMVTLTVPADYLRLIVEARLSWEELLLSLRFSAWRDPDTYNWPLFALLRFGHSAALLDRIYKLGREAEAESIVVHDQGQAYEIQRYCPHAGEDLSKGRIGGGLITCRKHGWTFELETGRCVRGGERKIRTRRIEP